MILNLTQHKATADQISAGVVDLGGIDTEALRALLTFDEIPTRGDIARRADEIAAIAVSYGYDTAMIGGFPALMAPLESALRAAGIVPVYAFSRRVSEERTLADGTVEKTSRFAHDGFIPAGERWDVVSVHHADDPFEPLRVRVERDGKRREIRVDHDMRASLGATVVLEEAK